MICTPSLNHAADEIGKNEMGGTCSTYGERRGVYKVSVGKREGKRLPGKHMRRWGVKLN
jgi:hypothetical protein